MHTPHLKTIRHCIAKEWKLLEWNEATRMKATYDTTALNRAFGGSVWGQNWWPQKAVWPILPYSGWKLGSISKKWMQNLFRFGRNGSSTASWRRLKELLIADSWKVFYHIETIYMLWNDICQQKYSCWLAFWLPAVPRQLLPEGACGDSGLSSKKRV